MMLPDNDEYIKLEKRRQKRRQYQIKYRKNLGEVFLSKEQERFKKYYANNREKENARKYLYYEMKKLERSGSLKSAGYVTYIKQAISPNGTTMKIFASDKNYFFQLIGFAKAIGYSQFHANNSLLSTALDVRNSENLLWYGFNKLATKGQDKTYLIKFDDVENVLNRLIKIVNSVAAINFQQEQKHREVQFETQRLIEWFNEKILPEFLPHLCSKQAVQQTAQKILFESQSQPNETEEEKMFENENAVVEETRADEIQTETENNSVEKIAAVPALTKDDLVDIADRADFVKETFDVNKKDALRAVILLKSQEINRDLSPLLTLLKSA